MCVAFWLSLVSVSILDMDPEQPMVNDSTVSVQGGGRWVQQIKLSLGLVNQKKRPIILGFHMTSEKQILEIFSWRVLLSRVFKKQENKRRIRERESVASGQVLLSIFH